MIKLGRSTKRVHLVVKLVGWNKHTLFSVKVGFKKGGGGYIFKLREGAVNLQITNGLAFLTLYSWLRDSIPVDEVEGKIIEKSPVRINQGFTNLWARDATNSLPSICQNGFSLDESVLDPPKFIKFFAHINEAGYTSKQSAQKRHTDQLTRAVSEVKAEGKSPSDVLFVPFNWYANAGWQLSEDIYAYMTGLLMREAGFIVFRQHPIMNNLPDMVALSGEDLTELQHYLSNKTEGSGGALIEELQSLPAMIGSGSAKKLDCIKGKRIICEVKTASSSSEGRLQALEYLNEIPGMYDQAYVCAPFIESVDPMVGVITFDKTGDFRIHEQEPKPEIENAYWNPIVEENRLQVITEIKLELLKNMGLPEILQTCNLSKMSTWTDFVDHVSLISFNHIIEAIKNKS